MSNTDEGRRRALGVLAGAIGAAATQGCTPSTAPPSLPAERAGTGAAPPQREDGAALPPTNPGASRTLGRTGRSVEAVSLGGEGILRTRGRSAEAVPMILEALRLGVRYCDTAPAYASSQDYYGEALRAAGPEARKQITLASKTHARDRDGALRLLDDSLRRLGTDHLDIWQLHDLREKEELDEIFGPNGAIHAVTQAKADGRIRYVGITGHHDPAILVEAMRRYDFDTVLCAINPADPRRMPFLKTVVPEARKRGMGVIGMKVMAAGLLTRDRAAEAGELIRYAASLADTVIIGCSSIAELQQNLDAGRRLAMMTGEERSALEARIAPNAHRYDTFKAV